MIPHRVLRNEFAGSEIRERVTACRKRLRENRVMLKAQAAAAEELFPETCLHGALETQQRKETRTLLQIEGQEVGIA